MWTRALPQGKSPFHPTAPHGQLRSSRCPSGCRRVPGPRMASPSAGCWGLFVLLLLVLHRPWHLSGISLLRCNTAGCFLAPRNAQHMWASCLQDVKANTFFCCERVGATSNISCFPWLLYLRESHPRDRGSVAGGHWESWSAMALTSQHLSHSVFIPNRDISPLPGWASTTAYINSAAASAQSGWLELCTMSLMSATHGALRLRASAQEETYWKLQCPWPIFQKFECCEELG